MRVSMIRGEWLLKYKVITYGDPVLRTRGVPIDTVDESIRQLASDMLETMRDMSGLGLAAQQVGRTESMCVIDCSLLMANSDEFGEGDSTHVKMPLVLINPELVSSEGEETDQEGCLSFPEMFAPVKRSREVSVEYIDLDGNSRVLTTTGMLSRAIQHEIDHLDGILFIDRMSPAQRVALSGKLKKLKRGDNE